MAEKPSKDKVHMGPSFPKTVQQIQGLKNLILLVFSWITPTILCFSRTKFGERVITLEQILLSFLTMKVFGFFLWLGLGISGLLSGGIGASVMFTGIRLPGLYLDWFNLFNLLVLIACLCHWGWIQWKRWRREVWHSQSFGISRLNILIWLSRLQPFRLLHLSDGLLYRVVEPLIWFWIGSWLKVNLDMVTGIYIQVAAFALFVQANAQYRDLRNKILDQQDAEIEAVFLEAVRKGAPKKETAGFSLVAPAAIPLKVKGRGEEEIENLIEVVAGASS